MQFQELNLITPLLRALDAEGYTEPTPIQAQAIPHLLQGRDLIGCAQTGTGKTAAFALPILQYLNEKAQAQPASGGKNRPVMRVLVLSPTRELASQIGESFSTYGGNLNIRNSVIFGGVGQQPQVAAIQRGMDILVATPGRLLDLMQQRLIRLDTIEIFVLDEADRMLDMGFIHDVRRIIAALPTKRQTLLFSATMPDDIQDLAARILKDPVKVEVTPQATTVEKIDQSIYFVQKANKADLLRHLLNDAAIKKVIVFTRTKHGANKVVQGLERANIRAEAIHGNKSQTARERALADFKAGHVRVLVATDIAARGIDVDSITHIINYDLPEVAESYVHRIGRTARAGASGIAFSFCDSEERKYLRDIEKLIRLQIPVVKDHPYVPTAAMLAATASAPPEPRRGFGSNGSGANRSNTGGSSNRNAPRREGSSSYGSSSSGSSNNGSPSRGNNTSRSASSSTRGEGASYSGSSARNASASRSDSSTRNEGASSRNNSTSGNSTRSESSSRNEGASSRNNSYGGNSTRNESSSRSMARSAQSTAARIAPPTPPRNDSHSRNDASHDETPSSEPLPTRYDESLRGAPPTANINPGRKSINDWLSERPATENTSETGRQDNSRRRSDKTRERS